MANLEGQHPIVMSNFKKTIESTLNKPLTLSSEVFNEEVPSLASEFASHWAGLSPCEVPGELAPVQVLPAAWLWGTPPCPCQ